jgi:hypothetical protein
LGWGTVAGVDGLGRVGVVDLAILADRVCGLGVVDLAILADGVCGLSVGVADLTILADGFCARATEQKNANGIIGRAASFVLNMGRPFSTRRDDLGTLVRVQNITVRFSTKLAAPLYNFLVIRCSQQGDHLVAIR